MFNTKSIFAVVAFSALTISCSNSGGGDKNNSEKFYNKNHFDSATKLLENKNKSPSQLDPNKMIDTCPKGTIQINDTCDTLKVEFNYLKNSADKESKIVKLKGKKTDELIVKKEESNGKKKYTHGKYFSEDEADFLLYNFENNYWRYKDSKLVIDYSQINIKGVSFASILRTLNIDFDFDGYQFHSQNVDLEKVCKELSEKYQTQLQYIDLQPHSDSVSCYSNIISLEGYKNESGTGSVITQAGF